MFQIVNFKLTTCGGSVSGKSYLFYTLDSPPSLIWFPDKYFKLKTQQFSSKRFNSSGFLPHFSTRDSVHDLRLTDLQYSRALFEKLLKKFAFELAGIFPKRGSPKTSLTIKRS